MKKYFKYSLMGTFFALFLQLVLPSFAITFNEPRKVILPKHANAVYGSLAVRDKMFLGYNHGENTVFKQDAFMIEIGQRPFYFWDSERKRHRLQVQDLFLNKVSYKQINGEPLDNDNVYTVGFMQVPNGSFISENMFFRSTGSSVSLRGSDAKLFLGFRNSLPANVYLGAGVTSFNIISHDLNFTDGIVGPQGLMSDKIIPDSLTLRDYAVAIGGEGNPLVPFPSPRMMLFKDTSDHYSAQGTSTSFRLVSRETNKVHYYGPWEVITPSGNGIGVNDSCPETDRCYRVSYGQVVQHEGRGEEGEGRSGSNEYESYPDSDSTEFVCAERKLPNHPSNGVYYNPDVEYCYDYQKIDLPEIYDTNSVAYEFKVHEMFIVRGSSVTFVSQNPLFREKYDSIHDSYTAQPISLSTTTSSIGWTLESNPTEHFQIDGQRVSSSISLQKDDGSMPNDICFRLCSGKVCNQNIAYVRQEREGGAPSERSSSSEEDPNPVVSAPLQGIDHTVVAYTYTVGFCPRNDNNDDYTNENYEMNLSGKSKSEMTAGLFIKSSGGSYVRPKVCVKRKVKCNASLGTGSTGRNYTLLSVDY